MDIIPDKHLKLTRLWIEIISKFLLNQKILQYLMENKFDITKVFLIFLSKAYLTIKFPKLGNIYKKLKNNCNMTNIFK